MSYTERFVANANRLAGAVADRVVNVGGLAENMVERAGADELGKLKNLSFSVAVCVLLVSEISFGDSVPGPPDSKDRGGRKGVEVDDWPFDEV